jgi:hypothetical protein
MGCLPETGEKSRTGTSSHLKNTNAIRTIFIPEKVFFRTFGVKITAN